MRTRLGTLAVTTAILGGALTPVAHATGHGFTTAYETIPGDGGTPLKGLVFRPTGWGPGPHPLLVMPASWSLPSGEYAGAAWKLAKDSGYVVVSYTSRGFLDSAGTIQIAGKPDIADVSRVIDWAIKNAHADQRRVGAAGISYGAGISLLAAGADRRIRAVAAMSAWADLVDSLYANQTVSEQAAAMLLTVGHVTGRPGADMLTVQDGYLKDRFDRVIPLAALRGAARNVAQINANKPAIMIANGWQDGLFPPAQIADFYGRLTTTKRLMLQPGDHGTAEGVGAVGIGNDVWTAAGRWFDHFLRKVDNGVDREGPVVLKANNGGGWKHFAGFAAQSAHRRTYFLRPESRRRGGLTAKPAKAWSKKIATGRGTVADSGVIEGTGGLAQVGRHWTIRPSAVSRADGLVFQGPVLRARATVGGFPKLHATITPSAARTSLFAYLYDVAPNGEAQLVTHMPYTLRSARPGVARRLDLRLQPIRWTMARGHHFALVLDTMDLRYRSTSRPGGTLKVTSPAGDPSFLTIPTN
ncbi:MAG: CocE/NonD family hydrolase [Streptosporangiaceae bacterium]